MPSKDKETNLDSLLGALGETYQEYKGAFHFLSERIDELESHEGDSGIGWIPVGVNEFDFSKAGLNRIVKEARLMALKNPLVNRAVDIQMFYVWGQGFAFKAKDEKVQEYLEKFWDDKLNQSELCSRQSLEMKEKRLMTEGNIFFVFFKDDAGNTTIRTLPFMQVSRIISEEGDIKVPLLYHRVFQKRKFNTSTGEEKLDEAEIYYRDHRFADKIKANNVNGKPISDAEVYHLRVGGFDDMTFGVPEIYPALDWARAYKNFLEDWATIVRAHRTFAYQIIQNSPKAIQDGKTKLASTVTPSTPVESNPGPVVGSFFMGGPNSKIEPIKTSGATVTAEDGRRLMLMAAAGLGFPETFFGDVSTGNLATAKTLDRPTELKITCRRELWKSVLTEIFNYVIDAKIGVGLLKKDVDRTIAITFPDVLEHDVDASITSIAKAATLNGFEKSDVVPAQVISTLLLTALGVDNVTDVIDEMYDEEGNLRNPPEPPVDPNAPVVPPIVVDPNVDPKKPENTTSVQRREKNKTGRAVDPSNNQRTAEALKEIKKVFNNRGRVV